MATEVRNLPERSRYELLLDGERAGFLEHALLDSSIALSYTKIEPRFEGRGLGSQLVRHVLDDVRELKLGVLPLCGFVSAYITSHPEYADLVADNRRGPRS